MKSTITIPDFEEHPKPRFKLATKVNSLKSGFGRFVANPQNLLFALTLGVYLITRFWSLDRYPIYFFSDEAVQSVQASDLVDGYFFDNNANFMPTFFQNVDKYSLGTTVYLQIIPTLFFGRSVIATRGMSVLVSLLGVIAVSLTMKNIFQSRYWWLSGLFLSITPAWFLHSRTAFEVVAMVSFYAMFLYCYLMYRSGSINYLYSALVFGALGFYSYNPGQVVVVVTGLLMLVLDGRYHWQQRGIGLKALLLLIFLALPFVRYLIESPGENIHHLQTLASYWTQPLPFSEKLRAYFSNYLYGLNPVYWYFPNQFDLPRHIMKGYGHVLLITAPLALFGLGLVFSRVKAPAYRIVLVALLAAPSGAAIVGISITRVLVMVIPLAILAALGFSRCIDELAGRVKSPQGFALVSFALLLMGNIYMTADALRNGPSWFQDYTLYGMQYGGQQVFSAVKEYERDHPETIILVSPYWANNVKAIARFFLPNLYTTYMVPVDSYISSYWPIDADSLFVLIPDDLERVTESHKFKETQIKQVLYYPNGQPGFYFVRLKYVDNIQEIFSEEETKRHVLQDGDVQIGGQLVHVRYSQMDTGLLTNLFDGDPESTIRTKEANPFVLDLSFPVTRPLSGVALRIDAASTQVTIQVIGVDQKTLRVYSQEWGAVFENRDVSFDFGETFSVAKLIIKVAKTDLAEPASVHLWEVQLK